MSENVLEYLRLADLMRRANRLPDVAYQSQEAFILAHGRVFQLADPQPRMTDSLSRACFRNAAMLTFSDARYTYCEGYAMGFIPVYHAWVINRAGLVLDPTWDDRLRHGHGEYFGVPFRRDYLRRIALRSRDTFSLIDNIHDGWPLCTGAHPARKAVKLWKSQ